MSINKKLFHKAASATDTFEPTKNFNTVLYTGNGATQKVGAYINQGAAFNGTSSKIVFPSGEPFGDTNTIKSISCWFKLTDTTSNTTDNAWIYSVSSSADAFNWFYVAARPTTSTIEVFRRKTSSSHSAFTSASFTPDTNWHHIVAQLSSSEVEIFLDGTKLSTTNTNAGDGTNTSWIDFGAFSGTVVSQAGKSRENTAKYFDGQLDQQRFFNRELTDSEVTQLSNETFESATKSTTDIFGDRSGLALYQYENNANDTGGASGYLNEGAIFNGSSSKVQLPSLGNTFQNNFSVGFWFYINKIPSSGLVSFVTGFDDFYFYVLLRDSDKKIETRVEIGSTGYVLKSTSTFTDNDGWHHASVTKSSSDGLKLYIDGSLENSSSGATGNLDTASGTNLLGAYNSSGSTVQYYLDGKLDEVRIYGDVLTATEVGHIASNTTASIPTDNLEAYYKFNGTFQDEQQTHDGVGSNVIFRYDGTASNVTFQGSLRFKPDWVWIKSRTEGTSNYTGNHFLYDSVRGVLKRIKSNSNDAESTFSDSLTAFNTNGFSVGSAIHVNKSTDDYVGWCWKGGGEPTATNSQSSGAMTANSVSIDGSLQSAYTPSGSPDIYPKKMSINTQAGFSIVHYQNAGSASKRVPHGLSATPKVCLIKKFSTSGAWHWHTTAIDGSFDDLILNDTSIKTNLSLSAFDANTFAAESGATGQDMIAYCFDDTVQSGAYHKFGSFTGNDDTSGVIVETGFEVAWLLIKNATTNGNSWAIIDNKRSTSNPRTTVLFPNDSAQDTTSTGGVNFLTNGFQVVSTDNYLNGNGDTMLYWAIAADPSTASTPVVTDAFDVVTYTGTGAAQDILTDCNADFAWIKSTSHSTSWEMHDTVRGEPSRISSDTNSADPGTANGFVNFIDKGFSVDDTGGGGEVNASGRTYQALLWSAGSHEDNLPTINTQGTINSTVSVNDLAGFSIVKYTGNGTDGATVGHGQSARPDLIFTKNIDETKDWNVKEFTSMTNDNDRLELNDDAAIVTAGSTSFIKSTSNANTITLGNSTRVNENGKVHIMYCFRSITGYSSVGTYTGQTSGVTITTGFRPRFILVKSTNNVENWVILTSDLGSGNALKANTNSDNDVSSRNTFTLSDTGFSFPNQSTADAALNENGYEYLYFAIK